MKRLSNLLRFGSVKDKDKSQTTTPTSTNGSSPVPPSPTSEPTLSSTVKEMLTIQPFRLVVAGPRGSGASTLVQSVFGVSVAIESADLGEFSGELVKGSSSSGSEGDKDPVPRTNSTITTETEKKDAKQSDFIHVSRWPNIDKKGADLAWVVAAGSPDWETLHIAEELRGRGIPVVVVLSKEDVREEEELEEAQMVFEGVLGEDMVGWECISVANPPNPVCIECGSDSYKDSFGEFEGWFCNNVDCDLAETPFKIDKDPLAGGGLLNLIHASKTVLLAKDPVVDDTDPLNPNKPSKEAVETNRRFQVAQLIDTTSKFELAKQVLLTDTLINAGLGVNPIPFIDAPLVIGGQYSIMVQMAQTYGLTSRNSYWALVKNVLAIPLAGMFGADLLKMVPGMGTVAGAVVDVAISIALSLSLGIAVGRISEKTLINRRKGKRVPVDEGGRPVFILDSEVTKVFKETYAATKEIVKGMLKNGTLSRDGLMGLLNWGAASSSTGELVNGSSLSKYVEEDVESDSEDSEDEDDSDVDVDEKTLNESRKEP
ncbi:hypothetical protein HDU79_005816 [Rhizoclosmatium sp. JEL0117]|nr:hypothetical protein HDU79_005816 [Rhizoclosmatium sp. JEL0117]